MAGSSGIQDEGLVRVIGVGALGRVIIATVEGDVHDIGKTIVVSLLKANGFVVNDLGRDVAMARLIEEADKFDANIIGTSALLTTTMGAQKELEEELRKAGQENRSRRLRGRCHRSGEPGQGASRYRLSPGKCWTSR